MAGQPIRGCKTHTTNLADRTCDDDLFSFISKKSHENRRLFLIKNVQNGCFLGIKIRIWQTFVLAILSTFYERSL